MNFNEEQPRVGAMTDQEPPLTGSIEENGDEQEPLDAFKNEEGSADVKDVSGGIARPRMDWSPLTDAGGESTADTVGRSGFQFDLGGALARLGGPDDLNPPAQAPNDRVESRPEAEPEPEPEHEPPAPASSDSDPGTVLEPRVEFDLDIGGGGGNDGGLPRRDAQRPTEFVEEIVESAPPIESYRPVRTPRKSVFDDVGSTSAPTLPNVSTSVAPTSVAPAPVASTPSVQDAVAPATHTDVPVDFMPELGGAGLPTLPAAILNTAPAVVAPIDGAPSAPDLHSLRSAQLRASRQQQQGKLFGRTLLAFMVIGGLIAAALVFGRTYLFPAEWDAALTPTVDLIQEEAGAEFDHPVSLVMQSPAEYEQTIVRLTIGSDWLNRVPEWRALGLATGEPSVSSVGAELARLQPAVFDAEADTIFHLSSADSLDAALRFALQEAFVDQNGSGSKAPFAAAATTSFAGLSEFDSIVDGAVDSYLLSMLPTAVTPDVADLVDGSETSELGPNEPVTSGLPIPIAYEVAARQQLGGSILAAAQINAGSLQYGGPYPDQLAGILAENSGSTAGGVLLPGDVPLADRVGLGNDDWSLAWSSRLSAPSVERLVNVVVADSYRPLDRGGRTCFVAVFRVASESDNGLVLAAMRNWVASSPSAAQAATSLLTPTLVQLAACDPGPEAATTLDQPSVAALLVRQVVRLSQ
jgi:hypothetical protein